MGLQYSITAIGSVILQAAVNDLGSVAVAAISTGNRISMFFCCPYDAMGSTMATYAGTESGCRKTGRVDKGIFASSGICLIYSVAAAAILILFGKLFAVLFVEPQATQLIDMIDQLFVLDQCILFSVGTGQYCALYHTGTGLWKTCHSGRSM